MYNRVPLIKQVQSKWKKFFLKIGLFLTPIQVAAFYGNFKSEMLLQEQYLKYFSKFVAYKQTGDILKLNPNI